MITAPPTPAPGSPEALNAGCVCPVMDNSFGRGAYLGQVAGKRCTLYITNAGCPLHGSPAHTTSGAAR